MSNWTASDIPSQSGRTAVVTGTGGLGFETALQLARAGADVILAGRSPFKGAEALDRIRSRFPTAKVRYEHLDLANLDSIGAFAECLVQTRQRIDILVNNAAVMAPPRRQLTADGFELQLGTNYLGHFALTGMLLPLLRKSKGARVVTLSSVAARNAAIDFDDLHSECHYQPMAAYAQSKLACMMFAFELQRRSVAWDWGIRSIAVHPGIARTDLLPNGLGPNSAAGLARRFLWFLFQPAAQGAWPALFAATAAHAEEGGYYGPARLAEMRGNPKQAKVPVQALDSCDSTRLWIESERLTGAVFAQSEAGHARRAALTAVY